MFLRRDIDPAVATGITLVVDVAALLVFAVCVGVLLIMVQTDTGLAKWDLALARWGAEHATPWSTSALRGISRFGGTVGVIAIALVAGTIEHIRRPNRAIPALLALTVLGQLRDLQHREGDRQPRSTAISQLTGFSGSSFPSGHAAAAAATFAVVGLLVGRGRSRGTRNAIAGLAIGMAVLVAMTRVMLGVHWLTDVLAGLALGWGWLAACSIAFGGRLLRFGSPVEAAQDLTDRSSGTPARRRRRLASRLTGQDGHVQVCSRGGLRDVKLSPEALGSCVLPAGALRCVVGGSVHLDAHRGRQRGSARHGEAFQMSDFWPQFWSATFENWQSEWLQLLVQAVVLLGLKHVLFKADAEDTEQIQLDLAEIKCTLKLTAGDVVRMLTPGGGGTGSPEPRPLTAREGWVIGRLACQPACCSRALIASSGSAKCQWWPSRSSAS